MPVSKRDAGPAFFGKSFNGINVVGEKSPFRSVGLIFDIFHQHRSLSPGPLVFKSFQLKLILDRASFARELLLCNDYSCEEKGKQRFE